jgi:predicted ATPase
MALHCASWRVLRGACQAVEQSHPYHAIIEALRRGLTAEDVARLQLPGIWRAALASLLPDIIQSNALPPAHPALATLLADALVALFHQLASLRGPLALVINDLHWADTATLALLGHLVRHVRPRQAFFLCTCRDNLQDTQGKALYESAQRQGMLAELTLPPLSLHEITLLTRSFLAAYPALSPRDEAGEAVLSDWCYRQSEGNPALALEALRLAADVRAQGQDLPAYALSAPIRHLLESFLRPLSQQAVTVLAAASIPGCSFDFSQAASMAGLDRSASLLALQELSRPGIIVEATSLSPGYYTFAHRLLREHLLATLNATQRSILLSHPVASNTLL